jgi:hypothetical protein
MGYLWPKAQTPKLTKSIGIENQHPKTPLLELHRKPPNRKHFHGFEGTRSPRKEAPCPHM